MATTVHYTVATGALIGYTDEDPPGPKQIPDPLPAGTATKQIPDINGAPADPGRPPPGKRLEWNTSTLVWDQVDVDIVLSPAEFWGLFTSAEREEFLEMAVNGTAQQQKKIRAFDRYGDLFQSYPLSDQYIIDSVNLMESAGIIGAGRAAQILAGP